MTAEFWSWDRYDHEARRLYDEGNYDDATKLLEEGLSQHPASAELRVSLGYAQLAREEFGWARRWFREALSLESDHEEALVGMGEVLLKFGERGRAFYCFRRVLELGFAEDADLMLSAGRALSREELFERALTFFRRALNADPECAEAAAELAHSTYRLGDFEAAEEWCRHALELEPELHEARAFLANLLYDRGDGAGALEQFERIPPEELWDPVAAWRCLELLRRLRSLSEGDPRLLPYMGRLEKLASDPTPEEQLLAEVEAAAAPGSSEAPVPDRNQLDLFAWLPVWREGSTAHRVRLPDGRAYEGDWAEIVRAMRDDSADPGQSVAEFMQEEARRLLSLTGARVPSGDPERFLQESARLGVLRIDR
ncbi:MAG: tetratricopeptide repeat protein [Gemmatimonadota bacterium]